MDVLPPSLVGAFVERGALGLLALLEAIAIIALWRWGKATNEARITEMSKTVQVTEQVTSSINRLSETLLRR